MSPLNDDYVKFIRFAQQKMDQVNQGIVAIVTNNAFLDNVTFRGMRNSLLKTFDQIKILNLHGNSRKAPKVPNGGKDQNVFDIRVGVCIVFFIKNSSVEKGIFYTESFGKAEEKFQYMMEHPLDKMTFQALPIRSPSYYLVPFQRFENYQKFYDLKNVFYIYNSGISTHKDKIAIGFTPEELRDRLDDFAHLAPEEARRKYQLGKDSLFWKIETVQKDIARHPLYPIEKLYYRPFDTRYVGYTGRRGLVTWPSYQVMQHMVLGSNLGIITCRRNITGSLKYPLVAKHIAEHSSVSLYDAYFLLPLYLYHEKSSSFEKTENFTPEFRAYMDNLYQHHYSPEEIAGYIYGVMYSPFYQTKYKDELSKEFARIPFVPSRAIFEKLSELGWELIQTHLEKTIPQYGLGSFIGASNCAVKTVTYNATQKRVYINATQYFDNVPAEIAEFRIGSYPVILKYLKYRKGRRLSLDEINHVEDVINFLAFTIEQIQKIDAVYQEIDQLMQ